MDPVWQTALTTVATSSLTLAALRFLGGEWIATRIKESVADEYRRALEAFKADLGWQTKRREQAARVAEFIAFWMTPIEQGDVNARRTELQRRYWEIALWLDAPVLRELTKFVTGGGAAGLQHKIALVHVRKLIVGADDDVTPEELAHWDLSALPTATNVPPVAGASTQTAPTNPAPAVRDSE